MAFKKAFSLLELIFAISIIAVLVSQIMPKKQHSDLDLAAQRVVMYLKHTRYLGLVDDKLDLSKPNDWFKARWTFLINDCSDDEYGYYFIVYSDKDLIGKITGIGQDDVAKDPITSRLLFSKANCKKYIMMMR